MNDRTHIPHRVPLVLAVLGVAFTSGMWLGVELLPPQRPMIVPVYVPVAPATTMPETTDGSPT